MDRGEGCHIINRNGRGGGVPMETWLKRESGSAWDVVAKNLTCHKEFSVNKRSLRDRFRPSLEK